MFIEEVILDGFKSYATRTVVSGFDPAFNAITGLNGSGKSNILDAICFVLGITCVHYGLVGVAMAAWGRVRAADTAACLEWQLARWSVICVCPLPSAPPSSNLSQVRVGNLQELVYKQGQAGITKATVTIVFNNEDKAGSPIGYEQYDRLHIARTVRLHHSPSSCCPAAVCIRASPSSSVGGHRRAEQVPDQRPHRQGQPRAEPLPLCSAEREQPSFPHHAGEVAGGAVRMLF